MNYYDYDPALEPYPEEEPEPVDAAHVWLNQRLKDLTFLRHRIAERERERNNYNEACRRQIAQENERCEIDTADMRRESAEIEREIENFMRDNLPEGKKSIRTNDGIVEFRKQPSQFFHGDDKLAADDKWLVDLAKRTAPDCVKVTYTVDLKSFKSRLAINGDNVIDTATGEVIDELRGVIPPDKCTVITP